MAGSKTKANDPAERCGKVEILLRDGAIALAQRPDVERDGPDDAA